MKRREAPLQTRTPKNLLEQPKHTRWGKAFAGHALPGFCGLVLACKICGLRAGQGLGATVVSGVPIDQMLAAKTS